ncbi:hypothetical protein HNR42_001646 [Deinobacterium chartae]|uniref:Uncharacterized protein n=1 Tax=Deinobacterium chartae TaxID=521158 RepID=A0A841HXG9_9DEIO|nr:hypothetical protein [Deinobacterium chartae]MBB6098221.1 hypothetical protein [Deinobacterium chartae]
MSRQYRYVITRPCLQEGSIRILKYLEPLLPEGTVTFRDEKGEEFQARVSLRDGRVRGMGDYYRRLNLGVNDVLLLTPLEPGRLQVESEVKPRHARSSSPAASAPTPPRAVPQRIVVNENAYVREIRVERRPPETAAQQRPEAASARALPTPVTTTAPAANVPTASAEPNRSRVEAQLATVSAVPVPLVSVPPAALTPSVPLTQRSDTVRSDTPRSELPAARGSSAFPARTAGATPTHPDMTLLEEVAGRFGYDLEPRAGGVRLEARLGSQAYAVELHFSADARFDGPEEEHTFRAVLVDTVQSRPMDAPRVTQVTREALRYLLDGAQLSPLTPLELRGYWNTDRLDLESAISATETASRNLGQRGVFSYVLLGLANRPAHSTFSAAELQARLGSNVSRGQLNEILETLCRPPFLALSHLGSDEYYLRQSVSELLCMLGDYAAGLKARVRGAGKN